MRMSVPLAVCLCEYEALSITIRIRGYVTYGGGGGGGNDDITPELFSFFHRHFELMIK